MGRRMKSIIPITEELLKPQTVDPKIVQHELKQNKLKQKFYYDMHSKSLSKLQVGDNVLMQTKGKWRMYVWKASEGLTLVNELWWQEVTIHCCCKICCNLMFIVTSSYLHSLQAGTFHGPTRYWNVMNSSLVPIYDQRSRNF